MSVIRRAFALMLALVLGTLVLLEAGLWRVEEVHSGPFSGEAGNAMLIVQVGQGLASGCCLGARADINEASQQSSLRAWVGDTEYQRPHADHDRIRRGETGLFSHWVDSVRLALPQGQPNDLTAKLRVSYPLQIPSRPASLILIAVSGLALVGALGRALHPASLLAGLRRHRRAVTILLAALFTATLALELGAWQRTETIAGPFLAAGDNKMLLVPVGRGSRVAPVLGARGDSNAAPLRSRLRLVVEDRAYTTAHADHDRIRRGEASVFSHWVDEVRFALPEGVRNGPGTHVRLTYPVQLPSTWITALLLASTIALWIIVERPWLTQDRVGRLLRKPAWVTLGLAWAAAALTALYGAVTLGAWVSGWGLPSTAAILESGLGRWLAAAEPHAPELVLSLTLLGTVAGWIAAWRGIGQAADEGRVLRALGYIGLPVLFGGLILSASAQWSGLWRPGDLSSAAIAGLVPFSDANAYFADANDVVKDGVFGPLGSRRPLAQTFRSTLTALGGYNYAAMVVVQSLLLALAAFAAAVAVARWRGLWAGLSFAAMIYVVGRQFHPTTLTESLGLFWGLAAIPFLIEALRSRSAPHALLASAILTVALLTRMGSMFTIPALLLWLVWSFGATIAGKLRLGAAATLVILAIVALNSIAARIYTSDPAMVGSNFSYTVCGLTIGGVWSECLERYQGELPQSADSDEKAMVSLMYRKAYENFTARPSVFVGRVAAGAAEFTTTLPSVLTQGYLTVPPVFFPGLITFVLVAAAGLLRLLPRMRGHEIAFWLLFWVSAVASAGLVFFDDGKRVMIAIYPVAALFIASGLRTSEALSALPDKPLTVRARAGAIATAALLLIFLMTPWLVHTALRPSEYIEQVPAASSGSPASGQHFVFGGRRLTGVLVVADGEPLRTDVPTVHLSDFALMTRQSGIETYQGLVTPEPPPVPFGFVQAPQLVVGKATTYQFIVPPEVMLRKDVRAWRFEATNFQPKAGYGPYWLLVTKADPLPAAHP